MRTHNLLISALLMTALCATALAGGRTAYFGLELGKNVPAGLKSRVRGNLLLKGPAQDARWDSFAADVKEVGNRTGEYKVDCIYGYKTYGSSEAAKEARREIREELVRHYNAEPGVRFRIDDRNDGVWHLTLRGSKLILMVKRKLIPKKE